MNNQDIINAVADILSRNNICNEKVAGGETGISKFISHNKDYNFETDNICHRFFWTDNLIMIQEKFELISFDYTRSGKINSINANKELQELFKNVRKNYRGEVK